MTPEEYEAKRQARYERMAAAAQRAEQESSAAWEQAHKMASIIPFGQPILVGHHSERADRNYRARIDAKQRKGYELHQKAARLRSRAESAARNTTIFSDDPAAFEKLADKIKRLEERQKLMVEANRLLRKNDLDGLRDLGFSEALIAGLQKPDWCGRTGFPAYALTNNSANIRRCKDRLKVIERHADDETSEQAIGDVRIVDNVEDCRLQIHFPGKPSEAVRAELKAHGFKWAPSASAWQRLRGNDARYWAEMIVKKHYGQAEVSA